MGCVCVWGGGGGGGGSGSRERGMLDSQLWDQCSNRGLTKQR